MTMTAMPDRTEAAEYYFTYINQVRQGDICAILEAQADETVVFLRTISDERSLHRYAPDKWTIRQTIGHVNDAERVFLFRAFWFARSFDTHLPSFDQNVAVLTAGSDERSWASHIQEFQTIRAATLSFFKNLPEDAWMRRGVASGNPFTVRALAYIVAGHVAHHVAIVRERYL
jgi:DinB family protein